MATIRSLTKAQRSEYRHALYEKNKTVRLAQTAKWQREHPREMAEMRKRSRQNNIDEIRSRERKRMREARKSAKYRVKDTARQKLNTAVRDGKIIKPKHCSSCGAETSLHGHHHLGYEEEHWFCVIWLCRPCHSKQHKTFADLH